MDQVLDRGRVSYHCQPLFSDSDLCLLHFTFSVIPYPSYHISTCWSSSSPHTTHLMAYCKTTPCQTPARNESCALYDEPVRAGDIMNVDVSASYPLMILASKNLTGKTARKAKAITTELLRQSTRFQTSRRIRERQREQGVEILPSKEAGIHPRPVLVTDIPRTGCPRICTMATFGGCEVSQLPRFLRHCLIPVFPTLSTDTTEHQHTVPQWRGNGRSQWIIAYPFPANDLFLDARWKDGLSGSTHYRADETTLMGLTLSCHHKLLVWNHKLPSEKNEEVEEYLVCMPSLLAAGCDLKFSIGLGGKNPVRATCWGRR